MNPIIGHTIKYVFNRFTIFTLPTLIHNEYYNKIEKLDMYQIHSTFHKPLVQIRNAKGTFFTKLTYIVFMKNTY
jgi:hypothetical protein